MSTTFSNIPQLRCWDQHEINHRRLAISKITESVSMSLSDINRAWTFREIDAPTLIPRDIMSEEYTDEDVWSLKASHDEREMVMRAETTASTYEFVRTMFPDKALRPPACFWQAARSYRREKQARASRLRYFDFYQLEMQCLYSRDTKADYRAKVLPHLEKTLSWLTNANSRVVESDRLPAYSESTLDIEVMHNDSWREVASISLRKDFAPHILNLEVAVGLDRVVDIFHDTF